MISSILAYGLSLLAALTLWAVIGTGIKLLLMIVLGTALGKERLLMNIMRYMPPVDFVSSLMHGFLAFWFGGVVLGWFDLRVDFFLGVFLILGFLIVDIPKIAKPKAVPNLQGLDKSKLPAELANNPMLEMFQQMSNDNPHAQQMERIMRNNRMIVLIGKLTGAALGTLNMLPFFQ